MFKQIQTYIMGIITASLLVGCGTSTTNTTTGTTSGSTTAGSTTTTQCRELAPILTKLNKKYVRSKHDYRATRTAYKGSGGGEGGGAIHNQGKNCLACHNFASGGTVFSTLHARDYTSGASGYRIKLSTGTVYNTARGIGNLNTYSFPSGKFTAQVMDANGNIVNSSATMSHDASRRACNSCHTASGTNGAPGRITNKRLSTPTQPTSAVPATTNCTNANGNNGSVSVSFNSNVLPILSAKCKVCHGSNGRFSVTTANATYANISALKGSARAGGDYLLQKSSNSIGHGGGQVISTSSAEYTTLKAWVDAGASNN